MKKVQHLTMLFLAVGLSACTSTPSTTPTSTQAVAIDSSPTETLAAPPATDTLMPTVPATPLPTIGPGSVMQSRGDFRLMVYIPAGSFLMGAAEGDNVADADEKPLHEVELDAYWMDQYEVTHTDYSQCVAAGACQPPAEVDTNGFDYQFASVIEDAPVVNVSWTDANDYCKWTGKRLPTEAEWEKAARGEDARIYPWGDDPDASGRAWFCQGCIYDPAFPGVQDDFSRPASVGSFPEGVSPFGVQDMAGNVLEWVLDRYASGTYQEPDRINPTGPQEGGYRVVRGGSWTSDAILLRSSYRQARGPLTTWIDVGFRCAMEDDRSALLFEGQPTETTTPTATPLPTATRGPTPTITLTATAPTPTTLPESLPLYALVYGATDGRIYTVNSDGSAATPITEGSQLFHSPAWSPAGNGIAMLGSGDEGPAIFTIAPDGSKLRKLFEPAPPKNELFTSLGNLRWSSNGARLLFQSITENPIYGLELNVHVVSSSGGGYATIGHANWPTWSPTGNQVAYIAYADDAYSASAVIKDQPSLASAVALTNPGGWAQPAWSPDGTRIALINDFELLAMNPEGRDWRPLSGDTSFPSLPAWAPSGDEIAFASGYAELYAVRANGTGLRLIVPDLPGTIHTIEWSPDGTRLAFILSNEAGFHLYVVRADGRDLQLVASDLGEAFTGALDDALRAQPLWSPQPVGP